MKYVIYQQGARGYGRISRSIKLMNVLNDIGNWNGIIFSGDNLLNSFTLPKNVGIINLPQIYKGLNNNYSSINETIPLNEILRHRTQIINQTIIDFNPDIFFIDSIPTGVQEELKEILIWMKNSNCKAKIILIVRDIIDSPARTILEWKKFDIYNFLENYYDSVFVFGNEIVFDFCKEYKISKKLKNKIVYCNYFSADYILQSKNKRINKIDILITVGGGIDGFNIINSFLKIYKEEKWILKVVIILGQQLPYLDKVKLLKQLPKNIKTIDFTTSINEYYLKSNLIICMGGYNTITEILALNKHPIVVPRKRPTKEQLIRGKRFNNLSLLKIVDLNKKNEFKNIIQSNPKSLKEDVQKIKYNLREIVETKLKELLNMNFI